MISRPLNLLILFLDLHAHVAQQGVARILTADKGAGMGVDLQGSNSKRVKGWLVFYKQRVNLGLRSGVERCKIICPLPHLIHNAST